MACHICAPFGKLRTYVRVLQQYGLSYVSWIASQRLVSLSDQLLTTLFFYYLFFKKQIFGTLLAYEQKQQPMLHFIICFHFRFVFFVFNLHLTIFCLSQTVKEKLNKRNNADLLDFQSVFFYCQIVLIVFVILTSTLLLHQNLLFYVQSSTFCCFNVSFSGPRFALSVALDYTWNPSSHRTVNTDIY